MCEDRLVHERQIRLAGGAFEDGAQEGVAVGAVLESGAGLVQQRVVREDLQRIGDRSVALPVEHLLQEREAEAIRVVAHPSHVSGKQPDGHGPPLFGKRRHVRPHGSI
jgi:hypothetical protein